MSVPRDLAFLQGDVVAQASYEGHQGDVSLVQDDKNTARRGQKVQRMTGQVLLTCSVIPRVLHFSQFGVAWSQRILEIRHGSQDLERHR